MKYINLLASLAATVHATGVLLPLYIYPSVNYDDNAANWAPVFDAITANQNVPWMVVINPGNGPGPTLQPGNADENYIDGTAQLNALDGTNGAPVTTIGYVRLNNSRSPLPEVEQNITAWSNWGTYPGRNISVRGIFFDEAIEASGISDGSNYNYINQTIAFARSAFSYPITTICNFGAKPADEYYGICDIIIAFESCLDNNAGAAQCINGKPPEYRNQTTIDANIPTQYRKQAAIVVHDFQGTAADGSPANAATLASYIHTIKANGVGWTYFTTSGYENSITLPPASVAAVAQDLAAA